MALRLVFSLPLRQAEGFLPSVLTLMHLDLEAPDHTTLSRRSQRLDLERRRTPAEWPLHLVVDSTGLSVVGEGEWAAAKYGKRGKRGGAAASESPATLCGLRWPKNGSSGPPMAR